MEKVNIQTITPIRLVVVFVVVIPRLAITPGVDAVEYGTPLLGTGASFPVEVYDAWRPTYEYYREHWVKLRMDYKDDNSERGKAAIKSDPSGNAIQYGASDALLTPVEYEQYPDLQMIPIVAG